MGEISHMHRTRRIDRVNSLIREEISSILSGNISDPRLSGLITITHVDTSPDLRRAKVFVSILGDSNAQRDAMGGLEAASGFIHRLMKKRVSMRNVPFLVFKLDDSVAKANKILSLMDASSPEQRDRK